MPFEFIVSVNIKNRIFLGLAILILIQNSTHVFDKIKSWYCYSFSLEVFLNRRRYSNNHQKTDRFEAVGSRWIQVYAANCDDSSFNFCAKWELFLPSWKVGLWLHKVVLRRKNFATEFFRHNSKSFNSKEHKELSFLKTWIIF